ncbi:metallophosphoesterase [Candidatus Binatia bacterium]|jgi:Icc-related predicted phosphoesterase|nr:metallophosphoesterase [Candidatus Binatia bacterium]
MRGLLVSDLHYSLKQLDWLRETSPQFDLVVVAGDTLDISSTVALGAQIVVVSKYLRRVAEQTRLVASSGNHDLNVRGADGERIATWLAKGRLPGVLSDGEYAEIDDVSISVTRWWDGPQGCAEVKSQLVRDAARRKRQWIWVYHAPPDASPTSWTGSKHYGDAELTRLIGQLQPDLVLTGHVHQSPFRQGGSWVDRIGPTWVFNAGQIVSPSPPHVAFDLSARTAVWTSLAGREIVHLDRPLERPVEELAPA